MKHKDDSKVTSFYWEPRKIKFMFQIVVRADYSALQPIQTLPITVFFTSITLLYQNGSEVNRVERWQLSQDSLSASPNRIIIDDIPVAQYHNGGRLRFGPDGMRGTCPQNKTKFSELYDKRDFKVSNVR